MNYFPHNHLKRSAHPAAKAFATVRQALTRDVVWNRPLFKAPAMVEPNVTPEPLPFMATRLTQRPAQG